MTATAFEFTEGSRRVLDTLGFEREGSFTDEAYVDGDYHDVVRYGLLADEWQSDA